MLTRVADGRSDVVRQIHAMAALMSDVDAPVPARGPWLVAALHAQTAHPLGRSRPRAVVVEQPEQGRPGGTALLVFRRRRVTAGAATAVTLLGAGSEAAPLPDGRPPSRLYARDDAVAQRLADGVAELLDGLRAPWTLRLAGLPLGDPTLRHLAAAMPGASLSTTRSRRLVDELDTVATARRSRDPADVHRELPAVLARLPRQRRAVVGATARLHAAIGQLEVAVVPGPAGPAAALLTLLEQRPGGTERWPWWGWTDVGGLRRELGSPTSALSASAGLRQLGRRGAARSGSGGRPGGR